MRPVSWPLSAMAPSCLGCRYSLDLGFRVMGQGQLDPHREVQNSMSEYPFAYGMAVVDLRSDEYVWLSLVLNHHRWIRIQWSSVRTDS